MSASLPNITGKDTLGWSGEYLALVANDTNGTTGALSGSKIEITNFRAATSAHVDLIASNVKVGVGFDASLSNKIYGASETVIPETCSTFMIIKY